MPRVLIVDDMALYRSVIGRCLGEAGGFEVVGKAKDGREGLRMIRELRPDLVTLDLEMPEMGGLEVLQELAKARLGPAAPRVVVFSSQSREGADITLEALRLGAADFVLKPTSSQGVAAIEGHLIPRLRSLAAAGAPAAPGGGAAGARKPLPAGGLDRDQAVMRTGTGSVIRRQLLVIASSTGGPPALEQALASLPAAFPVPVLVVQHMPPMFTATMADNLDRRCALGVHEARDGEPLEPSTVYVAPGDWHMVLRTNDAGLAIGLEQSDRVFGLRPAADVLLRSLADLPGLDPKRIVTCVFTGMGEDGLAGARPLHGRGMVVLTQEAASCVVYGMPKAIDAAGLSHGHFTPAAFVDTIRNLQWHWPV